MYIHSYHIFQFLSHLGFNSDAILPRTFFHSDHSPDRNKSNGVHSSDNGTDSNRTQSNDNDVASANHANVVDETSNMWFCIMQITLNLERQWDSIYNAIDWRRYTSCVVGVCSHHLRKIKHFNVNSLTKSHYDLGKSCAFVSNRLISRQDVCMCCK